MDPGGAPGVSSGPSVSLPARHPAPARRARADHRPQRDPACAGCPLLSLLRALRRAGIEARGRLSCEDAPAGLTLLPGPTPVLAEAAFEPAGARLLVLAGPHEPDLAALPGWTEGAARVLRLDPDDPRLEATLRSSLVHPGTTVAVAVVACQLGAPARPAAPPLGVTAARCNRCGGCLTLGCPAIEDVGGEAMVIDPAVCTGCGRCQPICRARAIGPMG